MSKPDVHIIGSGPAGCFTGISILNNGGEALISEKNKTVGHNIKCSGLVSVNGLEELSKHVDYKKAVFHGIKGVKLNVVGEQTIIKSNKIQGYIIDRTKFDNLCADKFIDLGGKLSLNDHITNNQQYKSNNIIGADGPSSQTAFNFKFPKIKEYATTLQCHTKYQSETPELVEIFMSNKHFPGLFGWVIPHNESFAEIGVGVKQGHNALNSLKHLAKLKQINIDTKKIEGHIIPLKYRKKTQLKSKDRDIVLVGDAAGQVKATSGGGIYYGASCGLIAGQEIIKQKTNYEKTWRNKHYNNLKTLRLIRKSLNHMNDNTMKLAFKSFKLLKLDNFLSEHGNIDKPTDMMNGTCFGHFVSSMFKK